MYALRASLHKKSPAVRGTQGALPRSHHILNFGILTDFSSRKKLSFKKQFSISCILKQNTVIFNNFASYSANFQLNFHTKNYNRGVQIPGTMSPGLLNFGRWSKMVASPQYRVCFMSLRRLGVYRGFQSSRKSTYEGVLLSP
jgi:hypothetical protein